MESKLHAENREYISDPDAREAYSRTVDDAQRHGLRTSVLASSATRPVRMYEFVHGKERYLFSCDRNRKHLRFYLRNPALKHWKTSQQKLAPSSRMRK